MLPTFIHIGLKKRVDLRGVLDWGDKERVSWLMELSKEKWGINRLQVKSLSIAFQVTERYEAILAACGGDPNEKSNINLL